MAPARTLQLLAATALAATFAFFLLTRSLPSGSQRFASSAISLASGAHDDAPAAEVALSDRQILDILQAPKTFTYQRVCISAKEKVGLRRKSLISNPRGLLDGAAPVVIHHENDHQLYASEQLLLPDCRRSRLTLDVPEFSSQAHSRTSALMLGIATLTDRVSDSLETFSRWLSHTGTPLVVLLVDQTDLSNAKEETTRAHAMAKNLGIELIFEPYHHTFEHDSEGLKNFGLAVALDKNRREETRWFGVIDDDTFFLSLPRMVDALKPYDPTKQWYIGALTEGHTRVAKEGFKAWGGAGIFISRPLMQLLAENAVQCAPLDKYFGDLLWRDCILELTSPTVPLTELPGLNQMDLWSDLSGWYEAGFEYLLTVHHWKSWHHFPIGMSHLVVDVAGADSLLQRYQFGNQTVFTNGYSIVEYPKGIPDLNLVELTMTEDVNVKRPPERMEFHHSFGRTRPAMEVGTEKISWNFAHALKTEEGTIRQFYVNAGKGDDDFSVIEIDWRHG